MASSSKQTSSNTSSNTVNPQQFQQYQDNYSHAQTAANSLQPYQGQLTAGFNPTQTQAQGVLSGIATAPNPLSGANVQQYENPYTNDVINASIAQNERARQTANVNDNQAATAAGAFGGSRSGVANALTNEAYDRNNQTNIANLNAANYSQAQGTAQTAFGDQVQQAGILSAVGDAQQQQSQNELSNAYQAYMAGQQLTVQQQALLNQALGMIPVQQTNQSNGTQTTTSNPGAVGILGGIGSLGLAAAMPGSAGIGGSTSLLGGLFK